MKKLRNAKWFVLGVILTLAVSALTVPGLATNGSEQVTVYYRDIQITLNGNPIIPKDANGNTVEPFVIDGTTYLPVRGVAGALGLEVSWDDATSTVVLSEPQSNRAIYITRTGSKYHYNSTCNGGTYWEVPLSSAIGMGLGPCDKCVHD